MRRLTLPLLLLLAGCPAGAGRAVDAEGDPWTPQPVAAGDASAVAKGVNELAFDLHRELGKTPGDVFFSPASVAAALGMAWGGAKGTTADELGKALHQTLPPEKVHPALGALLAGPQASGDPTVAVANRLWAAEQDALPAYLALTRDAYGAELGRVDFRGDPDGARRRINAWVAERTRDRIPELVPPDAISTDSRLVLTNAIYFKGSWSEKFEKSATAPGTFTLATKEQVEVPLMRGLVPAMFYRGEGFVLGELFYVDEALGMVVIVPDAPDGLPALEAKLTAARLQEWLGQVQIVRDLDVMLPRFRIEARTSLKEPLQALGVRAVFDPQQADLSGMNGRRDLVVSAALHQAFVEVNEEGTEAAAATAMDVGATSAPVDEPPALHAVRPFLFVIRDRKSGLILFVGRETDPRS